MNWRLGALVAGGAAIVVLARLSAPLVPPLYDGIPLPTPPYRYVSPPPSLASGNVKPVGAEGDLPIVNGVNKVTTIQTADTQVLVFFPQGVFRVADRSSIHIRVSPVADVPPPPKGSTYVGNAYLIEASDFPGGGFDGAGQPQMLMPAQTFLRVPPLPYSSVRAGYAGAWHPLTFSVQSDYANATLDHFGVVAAFKDPNLPPVKKPSNPWAVVLQVGLAVVALAGIAAGVFMQRARLQR